MVVVVVVVASAIHITTSIFAEPRAAVAKPYWLCE